MVLVSPSSSAVTPSATVSPVTPRSGRFRRLTYLRSHSHGDSHSRNNDSRPQQTLASLNSLLQDTQGDRNNAQTSGGAVVSDPAHPTSGWLPASQPTTQLHSAAATSQEPSQSLDSDNTPINMTRRRSATTPATAPLVSPTIGRARPNPTAESQARSPPSSSRQQTARPGTSQMPSIRFVNYQDGRASRPSLGFPTISRTLPQMESVIRVGRYSEKDAPPEAVCDGPSDAPVGFKSKVVSRKHCEFSYKDSHWWIKDTKSSSGTFLNRIRLSPPNVESKPYKLNDGDVVQLGIDFKGGEESIFRCVKIRIYCNKSWQQRKNNFNTSTHKQLQQLTKSQISRSTDTSGDSTDCTICLCSIAPCQALFIAPCSHTWHYKCIRPIIMEHGDYHYPEFLCPNCRAVADLEEDIEETERWEDAEMPDDHGAAGHSDEEAGSGLPVLIDNLDRESAQQISDDEDIDMTTEVSQLAARAESQSLKAAESGDRENTDQHNQRPSRGSSGSLNPGASTFLPSGPTRPRPNIGRLSDWQLPGWQPSPSLHTLVRPISPPTTSLDQRNDDNDEDMTPLAMARTATSGPIPAYLAGPEQEGPITPRNNVGPFIFDGTAGGATVEEGRLEARA